MVYCRVHNRLNYIVKFKVIKKEQLIRANQIAHIKNWPRRFDDIDMKEIDDYHEEQTWPILFHCKKHPDRERVLFEHDNGELYQLDVDDEIFKELSEITLKAIYH